MISKEVFFSLSKLNNVVNMFINDSYVDNMDTKDLVTLGQSIQGIAAGRITFLTVPTTGYMDEYGNEHLREEDTQAIFDAIINDDPLPEERNADNTPVPGTPKVVTDARLGERNAQPRCRILGRTGRRGHHQPAGHHRAGVEFDRRGRAGSHRRRANCRRTVSTSPHPTTIPVR